jgi:16S rRNA (adenine1518-N6/adenine1519-N6)-dimethyltransferase
MIDENKRSTANSVRELLSVHGIKLTKSKGQNFLADPNIPARIVRQSGIDKSCGVLEVGPGLGSLTMELCKIAGHVTAVELDKRFVPILESIFDETENISIIQGDILKTSINELLSDTMSGLTYHVCANLPYNITTPAITAFIETKAFESITVMIQKEVAERICAKPASPEYGAFTVFAKYHTTPKVLFDVSPECFFPRPKVTSSVVKMEVHKERLTDKESEKTLFMVVRAAFGQRRKTLINALYATFKNTHTKEGITRIVEKCGFDVRVRGEVLSIDDYLKLSSYFNIGVCANTHKF